MKAQHVPCNNCGASLSINTSTNFIKCNYCGTSLKVKRSSESTFTEILAGIDQKTDHIAKDTRIIRIQNDIEMLDRDWKEGEKAFFVKDGEKGLHIPTRSGIQSWWFSAVLIACGGFILSLLTEVPFFFIIALFLTVYAVLKALYLMDKLDEYEKSKGEYEEQRKQLKDELRKAR